MKLKNIKWKNTASIEQVREAEQLLKSVGIRSVTYPKIFVGDTWLTVVVPMK